MQLVATLITDPRRADLSPEKVTNVLEVMTARGATTEQPIWLAQGIACDIFFEGMALAAAREMARTDFETAETGLVIQSRADRRKKLLIADMDSTIVTSETLDELAAHAGIKDQISHITARTMRGEIDFKAALRERVGKLAGLSVEALGETLSHVKLTPGARTLVQTMRADGAHTVLVSGGFRYFTRAITSQVGFHEERANEFVIREDRLTGDVVEPILDKDAKLEALNEIAAQKNLPMSATLATGDGANDLPMIKAAGLGVAYHAKPIVEAEAPASIKWGDLTALLYLQGYRQSEFRS